MIEMLSVKNAAEKYGLSCYAVRRWLLSGTVKGVRVGRGKLLVNCDSLERYLSESYVNEPKTNNNSGGIRPVMQ